MKIILIGGVPGSGKTTLSYKLALKYKIDKIINGDLIKHIYKQIGYKNKYLYTTTHEAYKIDNINIIDGYKKHSKIINNLIYKTINKINDNVIIIEGATINIEFYKKLKKHYDVIYLNLNVNSVELIKRYKEKEKIRKSNWIKNIKIIELINNYLNDESIIGIDNNDFDNTILEVDKYVKKFLYNK